MATTVDYILKVKSSGAVAGINATNKSAKGLNASLIATAGSVGALVTGFGTLVTMAGSLVTAIINTTKAVIDFSQASADLINDINDLSNRSAISAENIKALQFALQSSGQSASQATQILSRFPSILSQASEATSRTAEGFQQLGVEVFNADGTFRDANIVFTETIDSLQTIEDRTTRAAIASDIFGRQAGALLQALGDNKGLKQFVSLTEKFGVRTGPKASKAAANFQVSMAALDTVMKGLKSTFTEAFGDDISRLILDFAEQIAFVGRVVSLFSSEITTAFQTALKAFKLFFQLGVRLVKSLGVGLASQIPIIGSFAASAIEIVDQFDLVGKAFDSLANKNIANFSDKINTARKDAKEFRGVLEGMTTGKATGAGGGVTTTTETGVSPAVTKELQLVGFNIVDGLGTSLKSLENQFSASQHESNLFFERLFKSARLDAISTGFKRLADGIAMISSPDGLVKGIGAKFGEVGGAIGSAITGLAALGEKTPEQLQKEFEGFAKAVANGIAMLPSLIIQILPIFVIKLVAGIAKALFQIPRLIIEAFARLFQPIVDFFKGGKERRQDRRAERKERRANRNMMSGGVFNMTSGLVSAQSGIRFTGGKRGLAMLHEGESVVPASGRTGQAEQRSFNQAGGNGINIVINSAVVENRAIDELVRKLEHRFGSFGVGKTSLFGR